MVSPRKSRRKSPCFSSTSTGTPARASRYPAIAPAGPHPATTTSAKDVLDDEPDVRGTFGEAPHVPREPILAVRDQHTQRPSCLNKPLLQLTLDAVQHRVLVRRCRHLVLIDERRETIDQMRIVRRDVQQTSRPTCVLRE